MPDRAVWFQDFSQNSTKRVPPVGDLTSWQLAAKINVRQDQAAACGLALSHMRRLREG
jgi:hypothetical protein